jgi:hypothetical protein
MVVEEAVVGLVLRLLEDLEGVAVLPHLVIVGPQVTTGCYPARTARKGVGGVTVEGEGADVWMPEAGVLPHAEIWLVLMCLGLVDQRQVCTVKEGEVLDALGDTVLQGYNVQGQQIAMYRSLCILEVKV